jgi:hypothetical protein
LLSISLCSSFFSISPSLFSPSPTFSLYLSFLRSKERNSINMLRRRIMVPCINYLLNLGTY